MDGTHGVYWTLTMQLQLLLHQISLHGIGNNASYCDSITLWTNGFLKRRTTKKTPSHYCLSLQRSHMFSGPMDSPQRCQWYFIIPLCKYSAPLASCGIFLQRTQNSQYCLFGVHYLSKISSFVLPSTLPCNNQPRYIKSLKYRHDSHQFYISESQEWGRS